MATIRNVRRRVDPLSDLFDFEDLVETGGIVLPDGNCIELVRNTGGSLAFLDSRTGGIHQRFNLAGQIYAPPKLVPSMSEALILPTKRTDCGSTVELFAQIYKLFHGYGVPDDAAKISTYFALASWFPEYLLLAPFLIIGGNETEARFIFQLLTCVTRHALHLTEINVETFKWLPMHIQPTMLIDYVHPSIWRLLAGSNQPQAYFLDKHGLTDRYSIKAVYAGSTLGGACGDAFLKINSTVYGEKLPVVNVPSLEMATALFQSKLVDYRLKHFVKVRDSNFDAPTLPTQLRLLAQGLGSCIVDAPELQGDIVRLLESQGEVLRANRLLDPNRVTIEALLAHCHTENGPARIGVNEIAKTATAILADRGVITPIEPKKMGSILRLLGFCPKRDSRGFAIHSTFDVCRHVHRLVRDQQVGDSVQPMPGCYHCTQAMSAQTGRSNR